MLSLIAALVTRGVIDNTVRDRIELELWLNSGGDEPLRLMLRSNCLQDIAGCRVEFENGQAAPAPEGGKEADIVQMIRSHQGKFLAGDITLSRREHVGKVVHNLLSIEFFVEARVRVLLQCVKFRARIERGSWRLSPEEDAVQRLLNREVLHEHVLYSVRHFRGATVALTGPDFPLCDWDVRLNRAEAYMSIIPTLREKYHGQPGGYLSEAYLVERTDILTQAAEEEDARGHGHANPREQVWEVMDFIEPEYVDQVMQAMRHPLFVATSRMTEQVQRHIINREGKGIEPEVAHQFLALYAGIISHILSTLLLTLDEEFSAEVAARRIENLRQRVIRLGESIGALPPAMRHSLMQTHAALTNSLTAFFSSLHRG